MTSNMSSTFSLLFLLSFSFSLLDLLSYSLLNSLCALLFLPSFSFLCFSLSCSLFLSLGLSGSFPFLPIIKLSIFCLPLNPRLATQDLRLAIVRIRMFFLYDRSVSFFPHFLSSSTFSFTHLPFPCPPSAFPFAFAPYLRTSSHILVTFVVNSAVWHETIIYWLFQVSKSAWRLNLFLSFSCAHVFSGSDFSLVFIHQKHHGYHHSYHHSSTTQSHRITIVMLVKNERK